LLNKHSGATIYKHTYTAQLIDKGIKSRKKVQNINKLTTNILIELQPQFTHEMSATELQSTICLRVLIYSVKICTANKLLIKTDLSQNISISSYSASGGRRVAIFTVNIEHIKISEISIQHKNANSSQRGRAKF
jgi:hypothetical protein